MNTGLLDDLRNGIEMHLAPLNVDQYHRMIRDGILDDGESIELIQGALIYKDRRDRSGSIMTHGPQHLRALNKLMSLLSLWVMSKRTFLQVQGPIVVGENSEPEPDCCLIRGTPDDYADRIPGAADVLAVFEVSYSSLLSDRSSKQRLYASARIPIYVIVNLQDGMIEVMTEPCIEDSRYLVQSNYKREETVSIPIDPFGELSFTGNDSI